MLICSSPRLFAAYRVLLRLPVPRHSPYALIRLNFLLLLLKLVLVLLELLEFHKHFRLLIHFVKRLPFRTLNLFPPFGEIVFTLLLRKTLN